MREHTSQTGNQFYSQWLVPDIPLFHSRPKELPQLDTSGLHDSVQLCYPVHSLLLWTFCRMGLHMCSWNIYTRIKYFNQVLSKLSTYIYYVTYPYPVGQLIKNVYASICWHNSLHYFTLTFFLNTNSLSLPFHLTSSFLSIIFVFQ